MNEQLQKSISVLQGIGPARAKQYERLGIRTLGDLIRYYPRDYIDFSTPKPIAETVVGEQEVVQGYVRKKLPPQMIRKGMTIYKLIFSDASGKGDLTVVIYNSEYAFDRFAEGEEYLLCGKISGNMLRKEMNSPQFIPANSPVMLQPVYHLTEGLTQSMLQRHVRAALVRCTDTADPISQEISVEFGLCKLDYALENIHFPKDVQAYTIARRRLVFEELLLLQLGLLLLKGRSRSLTGARMQPVELDDFYGSLPFGLTNAQLRAIEECTTDLCAQYPMNRLLQGDVGSGKTAVAAALCYFAHKNGMQSALMAPTEILAQQHYATLCSFLEPLGIPVCLLTGSLTTKQKNQLKAAIAAGEYAVVIGTHALVEQTTAFSRLGLVITDEQHRFGVRQRAMLTDKGENPHTLVMSATPIPRTLALIIYGDLDISVLDEMPRGRKPVQTYAIDHTKRERAYAFIKKHVAAGRQAYIVCPTIEDNGTELASVTDYAERLQQGQFSGMSVGLLHGRLKASEKEQVMQDFKDGAISILVATTVVEVGVDVANAVVMLIENAERFGLSQLHQLRGRVGRGAHQSYCILVSDNSSPDNVARLEAMKKTSDGFAISEEDLRLRGPGDFFGNAQHGLPHLRIADMAADALVLQQTQQLAKRIVTADTSLQSQENKALYTLVRELFAENGSFN